MNYDEFRYPGAQKVFTFGLLAWFLLGLVGVAGFALGSVGFTVLAIIVWASVWPLWFCWIGFSLWNRLSK